MKLKKILSFLVLAVALIALAACGQKSAEDIIKTELKDSYTGYSKVSGYDSLIFTGGSQEIIFDKKDHKLNNLKGVKDIDYIIDFIKGILIISLDSLQSWVRVYQQYLHIDYRRKRATQYATQGRCKQKGTTQCFINDRLTTVC